MEFYFFSLPLFYHNYLANTLTDCALYSLTISTIVTHLLVLGMALAPSYHSCFQLALFLNI